MHAAGPQSGPASNAPSEVRFVSFVPSMSMRKTSKFPVRFEAKASSPPGGIDLMGAPNNFGANATTCTEGENPIHWGEVALQWFLDHPRR